MYTSHDPKYGRRNMERDVAIKTVAIFIVLYQASLCCYSTSLSSPINKLCFDVQACANGVKLPDHIFFFVQIHIPQSLYADLWVKTIKYFQTV